MPTTLRRAVVPAAVLLASVLASGCGTNSGSKGGANADPAKLAPNGAPVYAEVNLKPTGAQRAGAIAALQKILRTPNPAAAIQSALQGAVGSRAGGHGTYKTDVAPWLGNRVGLVFTNVTGANPTGGLIASVKDAARRRRRSRARPRADRKASFDGVDYRVDGKGEVLTMVKGYVVYGDESGVQAIIAASKKRGGALADSAAYKSAVSRARPDRIGSLYLDSAALITAIAKRSGGQAGAVAGLAAGAAQPIMLTLSASPTALTVEATSKAASRLQGGPHCLVTSRATPGLRLGSRSSGRRSRRSCSRSASSASRASARRPSRSRCDRRRGST